MTPAERVHVPGKVTRFERHPPSEQPTSGPAPVVLIAALALLVGAGLILLAGVLT